MKSLLSKQIISILSISVFIIASCTERYDIELDSTYVRCVVYGELTTDTTAHKIAISRSGGYFSNATPQGISGANVSITDGENVFALTESQTEAGVYFTLPNVYGEIGKAYTLSIQNVDLLGDGVMQSYTATSYLPDVVQPDSINVFYIPDWRSWALFTGAVDPVDSKNYYMFHTWVNSTLETDSISNLRIFDDILFNGSNMYEIPNYFWMNQAALSPGDTVVSGICGITEDYFKFVTETQTTARPSNPLFSGAPANPRTNISNNGIGYFTTYSIKRVSAVIASFPPF